MVCGGVQDQAVRFVAHRAIDGLVPRPISNEKTIRTGVFFVCLEAAEETGFHGIRPAVFRTEHIAIAALVAGIRIVSQLMRLPRRNYAAGYPPQASGCQ